MRMLPEREYFYKYVTAETALLILNNQTLKYSSPLLFNDPFDTQTRIDYDFQVSEFMEKFVEELHRLLHYEKEPYGNTNNRLFKKTNEMWHFLKSKTDKLPLEVFKKAVKEHVEDAIKTLNKNINDMNSWWGRVVRASRVFCLAEEPNNLLMWAHYAKDHTGAVIEFKCLPDLDTAICVAKKVNYADRPPVIAKLDEYIKHITGQETINYGCSMSNMFLTKSAHWEYEKEWRVYIPPIDINDPTIPIDSNGHEILLEIIRLHPREINSIYFGVKMKDEDMREIEKCLIDELAHVKKFKCILNEKEYKLDFEEIIG